MFYSGQNNLITDVDNIFLNYKESNQEVINRASASEIKKWIQEGHFGRGTMEPKLKAALYFLKHHGQKVVITSIDGVEEAIKGNNGTIIRN